MLKTHALKLTILIAIILRITMVVLFPTFFNFVGAEAIHGSDAYDDYAMNLIETGIYGREAGVPDAAIPPMYSYALALVYGIFGRGVPQLITFHILLDCLSIVLLYGISRRLFIRDEVLWEHPIGHWVGVLAGLLTAAYPYLIFQNMTLVDTPFWMMLLFLFIWLLIVLRDQPDLSAKTWGIAILTGLVLGIATLARPITPLLAILAALWYLFRLNFIQSVLRLLPVAIISALCLVPWLMRNQDVYGQVVLSATAGANLWQGNSEYTIPVFKAGYDVQWTSPEALDYDNYSAEADAQRTELALEFLRNNPDRIPELLWTKFTVYWSIPITPRYNPQFGETFTLDDDGNLLIIQGDGSITGVNEANIAYDSGLVDTVGRPVHVLYFGGLLLLALVGVILSLGQWREVSILWFAQISMTVMYLIFHPSTRYRSPTDPLVFIFSAYAVMVAVQWWLARQQRSDTQAVS